MVLVAASSPLVAISAAGAAESPGQTSAVLAPINRLVEAINQSKSTLPPGIFSADAVVIDEFAPYRWTGTDAGTRWYGELVGVTPAAQAAFASLHAKLSVGVPVTFRVQGHTAYVVVPGAFEYDEKGARVTERSHWVFNCVEHNGSWLVAGNAWALMGTTKAKLSAHDLGAKVK